MLKRTKTLISLNIEKEGFYSQLFEKCDSDDLRRSVVVFRVGFLAPILNLLLLLVQICDLQRRGKKRGVRKEEEGLWL